jgi:ribosomal protein S18 acetylase RimI-like enzyme/cytidine deaminase
METKILDFSKEEDRNFINKNDSYKKEFEDLCNWPNRSETANKLFENFKNGTFVLGILDNHLVSMAVGWEKKNHITITDVFTSPDYRGKGLCKAVIKTLLGSFFTYTDGGKFKNNLSFELGVTHDNISAIKCYEYFGFIKVPDSYSYAKTTLGEEVKRIKMILTKEAYVEKYLLPFKLNQLKTKQIENINIDSKEELIILDSNKEEDRNFIINNHKLSKEFEEMEYFWSEYEVNMSNGDGMLIISPSAIKKYKSQLLLADNGNYYSLKTIKLTALEIFESHPNSKFSIMIIDNILVGCAIGFKKISENNYAIKHVRSIMKGACTKIVQNLVNSYWDTKKLQFIPFDTNNDPSFQLYVLKINDGAIGCYKKCGFEKVDSPTINMKMILTKEKYIEKYILPKTEQKLETKKSHTDQNVVEKLDEMDEILLKKTKEFMIEHCNSDHPLVAGMLHKNGHIVYGLSSTNPLGNDVHGEHSAISQAHIYDKNKENFISLVCMTPPKNNDTKYRIKAPCGICRELLKQFYPNIYIIVPDNDPIQSVKIISKYLLPFPYVSSRVPVVEKLEFDYKIFNKKT